MSKILKLIIVFSFLSGVALLTNLISPAHAARGGEKCYACPKIDGKKAYLEHDGFNWKCFYVPNGSTCTPPQSCNNEIKDPTLAGNNGLCPSGQSCSDDVYKGCVAGSPGPSCKVSSNSCRQSSGTPNEGGCRLNNTCSNYYCVEYRGTTPFEITSNYSTRTGRRGVCEQLDSRPAIAASSISGSYAKDSVTTIVGTGTDSGRIDPTPIECKTTTAQCLKDEFNVILQGVYTDDERSDIFRILSEAGASSRYKSLLKSSGPTPFIFINDASKGGGCPARVQPISGSPGRSTLTLYNYSLSDCPRSKRKSRVVHETSHVIRNGHGRLFDLFVSQGYNKDSGCYFYEGRWNPDLEPPYFIKTYDTDFAWNLSDKPRIQGDNETMAEFVSLTIVPEDQYPEKCPKGYGWVRENVFGDYRF